MNKYLKALTVFALLSTLLMACSNDTATNASTRDSMNQQYEFIGRDYVDTTTTVTTLKHRSTGCYYAMLSSYSSSSGVGGISYMIDPSGKPLCDKKE